MFRLLFNLYAFYRSCKADSGITNTCADLLKVGGLDKTFWVGYKSELDTQISLSQTTDVRTLDFGSYGGLRRFDGQKFSHSYSSPLAVASGGNRSYTHTFNGKVISGSTADDVILQNLALGDDIFVVVQDNNRQFFILGAGNGLSASAGNRDTGTTGESDTSDTITLSGSETTLPLRFSHEAGYQATLDYLESREV
jgi:hypothetical protein